MGKLGILPYIRIKGCSTIKTPEGQEMFQNSDVTHKLLDIETILNEEFDSDVCFTCYKVPKLVTWPRLNKPVLAEIREEGMDVVMTHFAFDYDTGEGESHLPWDQEKIAEFIELIRNLNHPALSSWQALYTTRRGARFIYELDREIPVDKAEGNLAWMIKEFHSAGFVTIDRGCADWTRLFLCPKTVRDGKKSYAHDYFSVNYRPEVKLDTKTLDTLTTKTIAKHRHFDASRQTMPNLLTLENNLFVINRATNTKNQTEFYKRAKKALKDTDSPYIDILLNEIPPQWEQRNNCICEMLGHITPLLLRKCGASVQQIFSLVYGPVSTLGKDQNWPEHTWNALLSIYEREVSKLNLEMEEQARKVSVEVETLDEIVNGMKLWCRAPELSADGETAREFARTHLIALDQKGIFLMDRDGQYQKAYFSEKQIIPCIRNSYLRDVIATSFEGIKGETHDTPVTQIINKHSAAVTGVDCRITEEGMRGFLEYPKGSMFPKLVLNMYRRNPNLKPTYDATVDAWLHAFAGKHYEKICKWISFALAFEEGPICALSLKAPPSIGKLLFIQGLAECLEDPCHAIGKDIEKQSDILSRTPFLNINEEWPNTMSDMSPPEAFKTYVAGDKIDINEKFKPRFHIYNPVRMLLTANNSGLVEKIMNTKNLSNMDRKAIGIRLLHFNLDNKGEVFLRSIGNNVTTRKKNNTWIKPEGGGNPETDFKVARHFLWLYENREKLEQNEERLLIQGNCAPGDSNEAVINKIMIDNPITALVCRACIGIADSGASFNNYKYTPNNDSLFVTKEGIIKYITTILNMKDPSPSAIHSALQSVMVGQEPVIIDEVHWYEINLELLSGYANEQGIAKTMVRTLHLNNLNKKYMSMAQKAGE